jgi:molecular chaperone HscB
MTNYFDIYELPISFHPSQAAVKSKFYELSRRFHPDRFAQAGADAVAETMRMAATVNEGYKTLKDADATMACILRMNGLLEEEEKYSLPPAFLMEMMDLNEAVSDYEDAPDNEAARLTALNSLAELLQAWEDNTTALTRRFDEGEQNEALLLQIKDMYFRKKYLLRIQERIDRFAAQL